MIRIEVLEVTKSTAKVAFYYPSPSLSGAVDNSRTPAGSSLTTDEIQQLRAGTLVEFVTELQIPTDIKPAQDLLQKEWAGFRSRILDRHQKKHTGKSLNGLSWDGTRWK